jgi:hypothetical protein
MDGYTTSEAVRVLHRALRDMKPPFALFSAAPIEDAEKQLPFPPDVRAQSSERLGDLLPVFRSIIPSGRYAVTIMTKKEALILDSSVWEKVYS